MDDLMELALRVEALHGASRAANEAVGRAAGWKFDNGPGAWITPSGEMVFLVPNFTGSLDAATSLFPSDATYRSGHSALAPDPSLFFCDLVLADGRDFHALAHTETVARVAAALKSRAHSLPSANEAGR